MDKEREGDSCMPMCRSQFARVPVSGAGPERFGHAFCSRWCRGARAFVAAWGWTGAVLAVWQAGALAEPAGYRTLAPGVLTVIPADSSADDPLQREDILEITRAQKAWTPLQAPQGETLVERAKNRTFLRDVWCLEFAFKSPRMIDVDIPTTEFRMNRKRVWYLLYRVKNVGGRRTLIDPEDATRLSTQPFQQPIRFVPHFVLESFEGLSASEGALAYRAYLDRVVPTALAPIRKREGIQGELYDSARMLAKDIAPGEERWGVAVWEDVDPRIDFFSIFVRGLTNAIRWRELPGAVFGPAATPGAGMDHALGCLKLDFWRPGDEGTVTGEEMSIGNAGMFERRTIGGRVLEALARPRLSQSNPSAGLEQLGLSWNDLLEPVDAAGAARAIDHNAPQSLAPLEQVVRRLAALDVPQMRAPAVRNLFGDLGIEWLEDLSRGLAGPVEPEREALRQVALERIGVTQEELAARPLVSLARVLKALDTTPSLSVRRTQAEALFGPATKRLEGLTRELSLARARVVLDSLKLDRRAVEAGGALGAFDAVRDRVAAAADDARSLQLRGLLGVEGPELYTRATAQGHFDERARAWIEGEGVDYAWVFPYER